MYLGGDENGGLPIKLKTAESVTKDLSYLSAHTIIFPNK